MIILKKFTDNAYIFAINNFGFFQNFWSQWVLGKNTLLTRKRLIWHDDISNRGFVPRFLPYRNYYISNVLYLNHFYRCKNGWQIQIQAQNSANHKDAFCKLGILEAELPESMIWKLTVETTVWTTASGHSGPQIIWNSVEQG